MTIEDPARLRAWIDDRASRDLFSGVVVVRSGDEVLFEHAAGLAHRGHRVPLSTSTRFQVASVTKMITAATALRLMEDGTLGLHRPLTGSLPPEFRPAGLDERHTLHHLLSHTSGLADYHEDEDDTWSFADAWEQVPVHMARGPKDLLPLIAGLTATDDPGEFNYADVNYVLAGLLIEWVTGRSFAQVATDVVLRPAGMADSGFFNLDIEPENVATAYLGPDDTAETWRSNIYSIPAGGMPDGGLLTTAADLAGFLDALGSGAILNPETVSIMLTPHGLDDEGPEGYGYGMELVVVDGIVTIFGHAGAHPGASAMVSHYVEDGVTVIVLCNQDRGSWAVAQQIAQEMNFDDPRE